MVTDIMCVWGGISGHRFSGGGKLSQIVGGGWGGVLVVPDLVSEGEEWFSGQEQYPNLGLRGLGVGIVV